MPSHEEYIQKCIDLALQSPPRPTNFRVGAILLSRDPSDTSHADDKILSTGYTMELAGNTHAEQCCLSNFASVHNVPDEEVSTVLPDEEGRSLVMYVTMEPCGKRLSGNAPCASRLVATKKGGKKGVQKVYFGVKEPGTFVGESEGCKMLSEAGIEWEYLRGFEKEILEVAVAGHGNPGKEVEETMEQIRKDGEEAERRKQEAPRNPKKRMMEGETLLY